MEIVGNGFLARNLRPLTTRHDDVLILAQGVSRTGDVPRCDYDREAAVVEKTVGHCLRHDLVLVFLSTASAGMYGAPSCPGREDAEIVPTSDYGRHKLALEAVVRTSGVRHLVLRLSHVVGPDQPAHQLLPSLTRALRSGAVDVHRGAYRDLIGVAAVRTIVDGLLTAGTTGEVVNIASGVSVTVDRIVDHLELRLGTRARRRHVDAPAHCTVSVDKLRRLVPGVEALGFGPDYHRTVIDEYLEAPCPQST
jgi:nucleoside-diphosphate-sugar epimerase